MKGKPVTVTSASFQDMAHMKTKSPVPLMRFRRKMLTFWEIRSLIWVVSAERRDRMSPAGGTGEVGGAELAQASSDPRGSLGLPVWFWSKKPISCRIRTL